LATLTGACVVALGPSIAGKDKIKIINVVYVFDLFFITIFQNFLHELGKKKSQYFAWNYKLLKFIYHFGEIVKLNSGETGPER